MSTNLLQLYLEKDILDLYINRIISAASDKITINEVNSLGGIVNIYKLGICIFFSSILSTIDRKEIYDKISTDICNYEFDTSISYRTNIENLIVITTKKIIELI